MRVLIPTLLFQSAMYGLVGGNPVPENPTAHKDWVQLLNDNYVWDEPDDNMTAALSGGFEHDGFTLGVSDEMLTHKTEYVKQRNGHTFTGTRTDELSVTVGREFHYHGFQLNTSIGVRLNDNLSGSTIQDNYHNLQSEVQQIDRIYNYSLTDDSRVIRPLAIVSALYRANIDEVKSFTANATIASTGDNVQTEINVLLSLTNDDGTSFWIGPSWTHYFGHSATATESTVHNKYRGLFLNTGVNLGGYVELSIYWNREVGYGAVGVNW